MTIDRCGRNNVSFFRGSSILTPLLPASVLAQYLVNIRIVIRFQAPIDGESA